MLSGCGESKERPSAISGYITVRSSEQVLLMMMDAAYAFMDLYQKAKILVRDQGSNPALASIFIDSAEIAVSTRPITPDERERARNAGFDVHEYKVAKDGIAIVVNPLNPVTKLTVKQLIDIFTGRIKNWSAVGGKDWPVLVMIWGENAGTFSYFRDSILRGTDYRKDARRFDNTEAMIKAIAV
ncbi:MAG: substrate-binding domain-containing protein, partial [candidate division WOR-3 bacterium]